MSVPMILIEMAVFAALFTVGIMTAYRGDRKYTASAIHNYPPDIQEEYFKTHERVDVSYRSRNVVLAKSAGVLLFTAILVGCALVAGARTFAQGFSALTTRSSWTGCCSPTSPCSGSRAPSTWTRPTTRSGST